MCKGKKHTPIVSGRQAKYFGYLYGRAKKQGSAGGMSKGTLKSHLNEWYRSKHK